MEILLTGSIAYDYLMTFPGRFREHLLPEKLNSISLSFLVESMIRQRGGTAPNIAYTLALLGGKATVFSTAGEDFLEYKAWLDAHGVDTRLIKIIPGVNTASFFANTDLENNQIASFYPGAMEYATELSLYDLDGEFPDLVTISPSDPRSMEKLVEECIELKIPYLYDPSQQIVRLTSDALRRGVENAQFLFVNDYEFGLIQKHTGLNEQDLIRCVKVMVVTLGNRGSEIYTGGRKFFINIVPAKQISDPTGVGDAFRGGFLTGYSKGWDLMICGQMGALAATYCLEQNGPQNHTFSRVEYVTRFRNYFDDKGLLDALL